MKMHPQGELVLLDYFNVKFLPGRVGGSGVGFQSSCGAPGPLAVPRAGPGVLGLSLPWQGWAEVVPEVPSAQTILGFCDAPWILLRVLAWSERAGPSSASCLGAGTVLWAPGASLNTPEHS